MTFRGARTIASVIFGGLSLAGGLVMTLPTVWSRRFLSRSSIAISELPWVPATLGLAALKMSKGSKRPIGGLLGLIGTGLALRPLVYLLGINARLDQAMRDGLGETWVEAIPAGALDHTVKNRFSIFDTAKRGRVSSRQVHVEADLQYGEVGGVALRGDLYHPPIGSGPFPVIIHIHGGSWEAGSKGEFFAPQCRWLAAQGYVVFDIDYRLSPAILWPEHLADVKRAIRWVRANAVKLKIDPERLALIGKSAGAHLALMAAYSPGRIEVLDQVNGHTGTEGSDVVQAVIAVYPPTDMMLLQKTVGRSLAYWLGRSLEQDPDLYTRASPLHIVGADAPPTLLAHGGNDTLVVPAHSETLYVRLRKLGVAAAYLYYPWGRHGFDFSLQALGGHLVQYDIDRFLAWALRPGRV